MNNNSPNAPKIYYYIPSVLGYLISRKILVALSKVDATIDEVIKRCNIPPAMAYRTINALEKLGLIRFLEKRWAKARFERVFRSNVNELALSIQKDKVFVKIVARDDAPSKFKILQPANLLK